MSKEGYRYNEGKLRWRNIPLFFIRGLVKVGQFGESKYDTYNFLKGLSVTDSLDSLFRHLDSFQDPHASDFDHESKCNHLFHVAWNALLAAYTLRYKPEFDDRFTLKKNNDDIIMTHCTRIGQIYTHKFEVAFDRDWAKKGDTIGIFKVKKK